MMINNDVPTAPVPLHAQRAGQESPTSMEEACRQFEGLLLGMVLKDSLKDVFSESSGNGGMEVFKEHCVEQVAATLAETGSLGIADSLLAQFESVSQARPGGGL